MFCNYCGASNSDDAVFCRSCGRQQNVAARVQAPASGVSAGSLFSEVAKNTPPPSSYPTYALPSQESASTASSVVPSRPSQRKNRPILWIGVAITAVVLLAGVGGFVYLNGSTPTKTLQSACDAAKRDDYQTSYTLLSTDYQRLFGSEEKFAYEAQQYGGSRGGVVDCTIRNVNEHGSSASATVLETFGNGNTEIVNFVLIDENGVWKISSFIFH